MPWLAARAALVLHRAALLPEQVAQELRLSAQAPVLEQEPR